MSVTVPFEAPIYSTSGPVPAPAVPDGSWAALGRRRSGGRTDTWTRVRQLPADARAASEARVHVRGSLESWDLAADGDVADAAILLTSELVTNALTHGESPVTVAVSLSGGILRVEVHDRSRFLPAPWPVIDSADAETGRGLLLVDTLATDWGFYRTPGGKAVYFTLAVRLKPAHEARPASPQPRGKGWLHAAPGTEVRTARGGSGALVAEKRSRPSLTFPAAPTPGRPRPGRRSPSS